MAKLSLISHYYNYPEMVEKQLMYWESLPRALSDEIEFILVDDGSSLCPRLRQSHLNMKVFRVCKDIPWNQAGARNLGTYNATCEWALFCDIDQRFFVDEMNRIVIGLRNFNPRNMYYMRIKELIDITVNESLDCHPNTFLVHLPTFKRFGMFDEDFVGHYGYEDLYMPRVWERNGCTRCLLNEDIVFEDLGFGTHSLNRDLEHNRALAQQKLASGTRNSTGILRFEWEQVALPPA